MTVPEVVSSLQYPLLAWASFGLLVIGMLAVDLGIFHRRAHTVTFREAVGWSVIWVCTALLFNAGVALTYGSQKGMEFLTAYLIEKSLSVDNIFVFVAIFTYFSVKSTYQHRVLYWGILGALIMRAFFIFAGLALIHRFHWITYVLGAFLVFTGLRFAKEEAEIHPERNPVVRLFRKFVPVTKNYWEEKFFVKEQGRWMATPLLVVLLVVEMTDVIFAVDSVPAVLAVSLDPFIVYTSNVFAILGLRALYFVLAGVIPRFVYLRYGLSAILVYVGVKMLAAGWYKIPTGVSLCVIAAVLSVAIIASLIKTRGKIRD